MKMKRLDRMVMFIKQQDSTFWIKWIATTFFITGAALTALDVIPLNKIIYCMGCCGWTWVGFKWKDKSVILLNGVTGALFLAGIFKA